MRPGMTYSLWLKANARRERGGHYFAVFAIPFVLLLERIFNGGYTPQYAASIAIFAGMALLFFNVTLRFRFPVLPVG
ncbi:hypothetical protein HSBAA_04880 [Vreelandella sulfidaeris]|uniref:Uncharacterized protein n=1 Tax=Vreelandella sulfidaeris TaxID=115553 RepID=A0A455U025_9GAMM|nr:hypothetical protein HSBAA_04880 [Halomonas sulfidaeris]